MAFRPPFFCDLADQLLTSAGQAGVLAEAYHRSAASRAYYAAFLAARRDARLEHRSGAEVHRAVVDHYLAQPGRTRLGNQLKDLRSRRNTADYDLHVLYTGQQAASAVKLCKGILAQLNP